MDSIVYNAYVSLLRKELTMATGCTEPIAIAYAGARLREVLGDIPEHCTVFCSGNMVKNVFAVTVPNSGGEKGIEIAALLGIIGGDAERDLDVLSTVTQDHISKAKQMAEAGCCKAELVEGVSNLYIRIEAEKGENSAVVEIRDTHRNITLIKKNGQILLDANSGKSESKDGSEEDKALLNLKDILAFADEVNIEDIRSTLERQIECDLAIAEAGLSGDWGASVGKTILETGAGSIKEEAKAYAAAGSDARMNGCALPVVINSGSGNQGITVSMPVYVYAKEYKVEHDKMLRALALANLISLHIKHHIGSLSAFCGAVSAGTASACGIAYMMGYGYDVICGIITDSLSTTGGMVCDGAKSSCASKIAAAVDTGILAMEMSIRSRRFRPGEGLVVDDIEQTIDNIGRMGRVGMKSTDVEILNIMLGK